MFILALTTRINHGDDSILAKIIMILAHLGVLVDREMDIAFSYDTTATELLQWTTNTLLDIFAQSRGKVHIVSVNDQVDVDGLGLGGHVESNMMVGLSVLNREGRRQKRRQ
jgi:hypothetical protein